MLFQNCLDSFIDPWENEQKDFQRLGLFGNGIT